jgi:DNA (cytosine-5)-methyltransferase 1
MPPGLLYTFYTEKLGHPEPKFAWRSRFSDYLYKTDPEKPVRTLKAQPGAASGPFHWDNRKFTEEELKVLQTIPQEYTLEGGYSEVVKQVGNSVPPEIAEILAKAISQELFGNGYEEVKPMPPDEELNFRSRKRTSSEEYKQKAREALGDRWVPPRDGEQSGLQEFDEESTEEEEHETKVQAWKYEDRFNRESVSEESIGTGSEEDRVYQTESYVDSGTIHIKIEGQRDGELSLYLKPNNGVWGSLNDVKVKAESIGVEDIYYVWHIVAEDVIERTDYEKFMDVIGHYSTNQEGYETNVELRNIEETVLTKAIEFFSKSENCNRKIDVKELETELDVSRDSLVEALEELRSHRYEIRTSSTHSTMPQDKILCTYPFPDMNESSHFDSSIELEDLRKTVES